MLSCLSGYGIRYLKSQAQFRRKNKSSFSYITMNSVAHTRIAYHLAFYLGVQITEMETEVLRLVGEKREVIHHDRTTWNYTVNIGPTSPHWQYPVRDTWTIAAPGDLDQIASEMSGFVRELA